MIIGILKKYLSLQIFSIHKICNKKLLFIFFVCGYKPFSLVFRLFKKIKEKLEQHGDRLAKMRDKEGHTPLHWAALCGYNEICEMLLEKGCPLNDHSHNDYGPRPIHWACVNGHVVTVDMFLEKGVHIDTTDLNGCSPLLIAAQYGQSLVISYLLQKGANKFHTDVNGDSALHWGAFKGEGRREKGRERE